MTITTEKWQFTIGKSEAEKLKRLDNERAEMEARNSIAAKETVLRAEIEIAKLNFKGAKNAKPEGGGDMYHNCSFGQPFRVDVPVQVPQIKGSDDGAIEHAMRMTGRTREEIETMWGAIKQYYQDKNKPEQQ